MRSVYSVYLAYFWGFCPFQFFFYFAYCIYRAITKNISESTCGKSRPKLLHFDNTIIRSKRLASEYACYSFDWSLSRISLTPVTLSSAEATRERKGARERVRKEGVRGIMGRGKKVKFLPPSQRSPRAHHSLPPVLNRSIYLACSPSPLPLKSLGNLCGGESSCYIFHSLLFAGLSNLQVTDKFRWTDNEDALFFRWRNESSIKV